MLRFRWLVSDADSYTSPSIESVRPEKRESASRMSSHLASAVEPGTRLVVAIAPGLTIEFVLPSSPCSTAFSESKGRPVLFTPSLSRACSGPSDSHTRAKRNGLETLMIANSCSASPTP
jgi:hypothetical protein